MTIAILAVAVSSGLRPVNAGGPQGRVGKDPLTILSAQAQIAELDQLVADFHRAASYGGNLDAMMLLWADGSSLTFNGTAFDGIDAVRDYFANVAGPFKHFWVSLAPEFKTDFDLQGDTASLYLECHFADPSVTPYVIRADIKVLGTAKRVRGGWRFEHLDLTTGAAL